MTAPTSFCPHFQLHNCRACQQMAHSLEFSQQQKFQSAQKRLNFPAELFAPGSESARGGRTRIKYAIMEDTATHHPLLAIPQGPLHYQALVDCPLHHPKLIEVAQFIQDQIVDLPLLAYNLHTQKGEWKYLHLTIAPNQEIMIKFVFRSREARERLIKWSKNILIAHFPAIKVIALNYLPQHQARIEGEDEEIITTQKFLHFELGKRFFLAGPKSFVQAYFPLANELYLTAEKWLAEIGPGRVYDWFCGPGSFSLLASPQDSQVIGLEISLEAIQLAQLAAKEQRSGPSFSFFCGDAYTTNPTLLPSLIQASSKSVDRGPTVFLANPPRRGLGEQTVSLIKLLSPDFILYSSCFPESLANDLANLGPRYQIKQLKLLDLFPYTDHLEALTLLQYQGKF